RGRALGACPAVCQRRGPEAARALVLRTQVMKIRLGHSPDPDDAFMFWALTAGVIDNRGFEFEHVLRDIQTLNEWALEGRLEVTSGRAAAGLLIHEGQLTYESLGLRKVIDLGEWWLEETGLPLPLGVNVARRDLGEDALARLSKVLRASIEAGLEHRDEAMR